MISHNELNITPVAYGQKPDVLGWGDLSACANKVRKVFYWAPNGYDLNGRMTFLRIEDDSSKACKYDRKQVDPACAAAKCPRIGGAE
jgi:hypothetical protein